MTMPRTAAAGDAPFSFADFRARAATRLSLDLSSDALDPSATPSVGDHSVDAELADLLPDRPSRLAAVLLPVVARPEEATMLLTRRADALRDHSGQIALPGGKIDPHDASPVDAALREAEEEVGLSRAHVAPIGYLDPYLTGTGYRILPVVALVRPPFELTLNSLEVDEVFEVPLGFLMQASNHQRQQRQWRGRLRHHYAMPYRQWNIWGATAGILRNLYERLYC
jgi:8-oxo-dGTP pyrophosphatase MutT (NUDIX family)